MEVLIISKYSNNNDSAGIAIEAHFHQANIKMHVPSKLKERFLSKADSMVVSAGV